MWYHLFPEMGIKPHVKMYPMDFEEFLWASGHELMMSMISDCFLKRKPLGESMHRQVMSLFRQYMVVGGMPQAVAEFFESHDLALVDRTKRAILALYRGVTASGRLLYYHSQKSKNDSQKRLELDFLVAKSKIGRRKNISPIEVKSGKSYTLKSLTKAMAKYGQYLDTPYVIHPKDLSVKDGIVFLPFYMVPLL